jgi:hypothetical protein
LDRSTTSSGAFSGILAYGILKMNGMAGLKGWQWIFCLEGLVTVVVGAISFFYMHDVSGSRLTYPTPYLTPQFSSQKMPSF